MDKVGYGTTPITNNSNLKLWCSKTRRVGHLRSFYLRLLNPLRRPSDKKESTFSCWKESTPSSFSTRDERIRPIGNTTRTKCHQLLYYKGWYSVLDACSFDRTDRVGLRAAFLGSLYDTHSMPSRRGERFFFKSFQMNMFQLPPLF